MNELDKLSGSRRELATYHGLLARGATMTKCAAPASCPGPSAHNLDQFAAWLERVKQNGGRYVRP